MGFRFDSDAARNSEWFQKSTEFVWIRRDFLLSWWRQQYNVPPPTELCLEKKSTTLEPTGAPAVSAKAIKPKGRRGRPPLEWSPARTFTFELMEHHGDFTTIDPEWNAQARLEEKVKELFEKQGFYPAESTIRSNVVKFLREWRAQRAASE